MNIKEDVTFLDMSGLYADGCVLADYIRSGGEASVRHIDLEELRGTDGYCDDAAQTAIRNAVLSRGVSTESIHYIDHGNYHYITKLLLDFMDIPFNLLVIDNHPDMQPPAFGDILSCGGWVRACMEENPYLKNVYLYGVDPLLITDDIKSTERLTIIEKASENIPEQITEFPLYISLDKDALSPDEYLTNWEQGSLTAESLASFLKKITGSPADFGTAATKKVHGIDICGGIPPFTPFESLRGNSSDSDISIEEMNYRTDIKIYELMRLIISL